MSWRMWRTSAGMVISGALRCGRCPSVGSTSTTDFPPRLRRRYSPTTTGTSMSLELWIMWHGTLTWLRSKLFNIRHTLSPMSGRMLNSVRLNSCIALDSRSPPTISGANPVNIDLWFSSMAAYSWSS
ncbi:basic helix-loop-helix (bHLH) DNA-bindingsuperfamily protein [Striga asiatica]|uniref:Basic helix-loop-helix (BHLH) DNA-bindingsuperfamily protein n=1 Tax=Striga asiatica TaxID=4170 RepID=A0A5A7NX50_STRAF|nr:basic helix-loop-helix (bHLH) DNA-bindingsuperfamily protein [Striga asiatica]